MQRILVASLDTVFPIRCSQALGGQVEVERLEPTLPALRALRGRLPPDLLVLDNDRELGLGGSLNEAIRLLREGEVDCPLAVLGDSGDAQAVLAAIRAGAADFLEREGDGEGLRVELQRHLAAAANRAPREAGRLTSVIAAQPNSGEGLFAANLAALGAAAQRDTLLIDCSLPQSDACAALNLDCQYTLGSAFHDLRRLDRLLLNSALARHGGSGLRVLPLAFPGEDLSGLTADRILSVLSVLRGLFQEVVLLLSGLEQEALLFQAIDGADRCYLVTTQKFTAVKAAKEMLGQLEIDPDTLQRATLVIDDYSNEIALDEAQMLTALGLRRAVRLPPARVELVNALNLGEPLALSRPRSPWSRAVKRLAEQAAPLPQRRSPGEPSGTRRSGLFGRLLPRAS